MTLKSIKIKITLSYRFHRRPIKKCENVRFDTSIRTNLGTGINGESRVLEEHEENEKANMYFQWNTCIKRVSKPETWEQTTEVKLVCINTVNQLTERILFQDTTQAAESRGLGTVPTPWSIPRSLGFYHPHKQLITGTVYRSPDIFLTVENTVSLARIPSTSHCLKWDTSPPNYVERIAQHVREEEGRKDGRNERKSEDLSLDTVDQSLPRMGSITSKLRRKDRTTRQGGRRKERRKE